MAGREIYSRIRLDGEKEYNAALRSANTNLKTLRSALKAETAELGANATAQQKAGVRADSLKKQIAEQQKIVETCRKALAEAKSTYGDNEAVVAKWEQKLNEARATLANMQNDLAGLDSGFKNASSAAQMGVVNTKSFADALSSVSEACAGVSTTIENIFSGIMNGIKATVTELWDVISETATKANNYTDIAGYWGTSAATVQQWSNAVKGSGNAFEDFTSTISRLTLGGKGDLISEYLGVSSENYESEWDYAVACMRQMAALRSKGELSDSFWEDVFGERKATKVMDLLDDWGKIEEELEEFDADNGGFGMDSETIQTMSDLYVEVQELQTMWTALKDDVAGGFGDIAMNLVINAQSALTALNDYLKAETPAEREAALKKLRESIEAFFTSLADAIRAGMDTLKTVGQELSQSDDPLTAAIGSFLVGITDALQWMVDNADAVKKAFEAIFGLWLFMKLGMIGSKLASIVASIDTIRAFKGWSALGGAAVSEAGNAAGAGAASAGGGLFSVLKGIPMSAGMAGGAGTLLPIGALLAGGFAGAKLIQANLDDEQLNAVYGRGSGEGGMLDTMSEESWRRAFDYFKIFSDADKTGTDEAFDARDALLESLESDGIDLSEQAVSLLENVFLNKMNESDPDGMIEAIEHRFPGFFDADAFAGAFSTDSGPGGYTDLSDVVTWGSTALQTMIDAVGSNATEAPATTDAETATSIKQLPGAVARAVASLLGSMKVEIDGQEAGRILTPGIARVIYAMTQ